MSDNQFIEEEHDRAYLWEQAYIEAEKRQQMIDAWQEEEERLPAKIEIVVEKKREEVK